MMILICIVSFVAGVLLCAVLHAGKKREDDFLRSFRDWQNSEEEDRP